MSDFTHQGTPEPLENTQSQYLQNSAASIHDDTGSGHMHMLDPGQMQEHMAVLQLVQHSDATHIAVTDGNWFDPDTWAAGEVPGDGAQVLIPDGISVTYAGASSVSLHTVRVDGTLEFATDRSSEITFDTLVVNHGGHLSIGTQSDPVQTGVTVTLTVANNGAIDPIWDPTMVSRGVISMGQVDIHGTEKDSHEKVLLDPMAGDTSIRFDSVPTGWAVGDTIVIAGTRYDGYKWDNDLRAVRPYPNEDEVRIITAINADGTVHFDDPLAHNHDAPRGDLKTSVANMSRNVTIQTENHETAQVFERGHVMFMHSDEVDVRFAAFEGLGRTDKSTDSFDVSDLGQTSFDSNIQGRYPIHLHRTGTEDPSNPAILHGNAVFNSPGWGITHHDANAILTNNATFDTFGAGFVAETGNEIGAWNDNIAIYAQGQSWDDPKNVTNLSTFDIARSGDGFWFQGRMVTAEDNVAASVNTGFVYFHRNGDDRMIPFGADLFVLPEALYNDPNITAHETPILGFARNETFAAREGLHVVKENPNQGHDVWSHLEDFTAWSVQNGVHLEYTSHYLLRNFDLVGKEDSGFSPAREGISIGNNTTEVMVVGGQIAGFETGVDFWKSLNADVSGTPENHDYVLVDVAVSDAVTPYGNFDPNLDRILTSADLPLLTPDLNLDRIVLGQGGWGATEITGTKSDTLGTVAFPGGTDVFQMPVDASQSHLETDGYWQTSSGETYFLLDIYFTDRVTGEIFFETHPVYVPVDIANGFGAPWSPYSEARFNGIQDIVDSNGIVSAGDNLLGVSTQITQSFGLSEQQIDGQNNGLILGTAGNDFLTGTGANDRLIGFEGNDVLQGGGGLDTAIFSGNQSHHTLTLHADGATLEDRTGQNGIDQLIDVEFVEFDSSLPGVPFDLARFDGASLVTPEDFSKLTELYVATFNRAPDAFGLAFWASELGNGMSFEEIAALFIQQPETIALYPADQPSQYFISSVYENLLGRAPDSDGLKFWLETLESGDVTRDQIILALIEGTRSPDTPAPNAAFAEQQLADQNYLASKTSIGTDFAVVYGMSDVALAREVMQIYDGSQTSLAATTDASLAYYEASLDPTEGAFLMPLLGVASGGFE